MEVVSPEGLRVDGRRAQELRQLKCELGLLPNCDGSGSFEMGNTKVFAVVNGPVPAGRQSNFRAAGQVRCEVSIASFCAGERRRRSRGDRRAAEYAAFVQAALQQMILVEQLQRAEVAVHVQVLQADGGERAACINAAVLAVANAGIPVRDLLAACEVGYLQSTALLDLNVAEVNGQGPQTSLAFFANLGQVAVLEVAGGALPPDVLEEVCLLAQEGSKAVAQFMRSCLLSHAGRLAKCQGVTTF